MHIEFESLTAFIAKSLLDHLKCAKIQEHSVCINPRTFSPAAGIYWSHNLQYLLSVCP